MQDKKQIFMQGPSDIPGLPLQAKKPGTSVKQLLVQPSSFSIGNDDQSAMLLREYNRCLVERHGHMNRKSIKAKDTVDLRPILSIEGTNRWHAPDPKLEFEDLAYVATDYYYCFIPCFEEGVYHINGGRYIYWKLKTLDMQKHIMTVFVQDYIYYDGESGWQPGVYGELEWTFEDPETASEMAVTQSRKLKCDCRSLPGSVTDYVTLYGIIDVKNELGWTNQRIAQWDALVVEYAKKAKERLKSEFRINNLESLGAMFINYTVKTNRILTEHKAAKASRPASKAEHEAFLSEKAAQVKISDADSKNTESKPKERRIRTIGAIEITSRERPKPGRRAMANYKKAAWKTRGHIRTLRSGKKIRVKESTHRRKALLSSASDIPETTPMTLRIKDAHPAKKPAQDNATQP